MSQLSPISQVWSRDLRLVPDADTARAIGAAYAGMLEVDTRRLPPPAPNKFGAAGAAIAAMSVGQARTVTYSGDMHVWLDRFQMVTPGLWQATRKGDKTWIVERIR